MRSYLILALLFVPTLCSYLKFNDDHTLVILQLTDLHNHNRTPGIIEKNVELTKKILSYVDPDVVAVTGDLVDAVGDSLVYQEIWEQATAPFSEAQVPYALIPGNHDYDGNQNIEDVFNIDVQHNYSLTKYSQSGGFDYYIPVQSAFEGKGDLTVSNLWFFNTHARGCEGDVESYGCIEPGQVDWFNEQSQDLQQKYGKIPQLAFLHIPIREYLNIYNEDPFSGVRGEPICCSSVNTGFFEAAKKNNVKAMFVGHDHMNDYNGTYEGVELVYGRKSGYGGYDTLPGRPRGARVIVLKEQLAEDGTIEVTFSHYVVTEDGTKYVQDDKNRRFDRPQTQCISGGSGPIPEPNPPQIPAIEITVSTEEHHEVTGTHDRKEELNKRFIPDENSSALFNKFGIFLFTLIAFLWSI